MYTFPPFSLATTFEISNPVREGDYFIVDINVSGISSDSAFVQGMFTHTEGTNYFGYTWGQIEDWVEYQSTTKEFIISKLPIILKDVSQKIWVRPNYDDSGYKGPGDYFLRFKRYTGSSDTAVSETSNTLTISLTEPITTPTPSPTPSSTPSPSPTNTSTPTPTPTSAPITLSPTKTPAPTPTKVPTLSSTPSPTQSLAVKTPTVTTKITPTITPPGENNPDLQVSTASSWVLGESTSALPTASQSATAIPQSSNSVFKYTFIFGVVIISISGGLLYFRHKTD